MLKLLNSPKVLAAAALLFAVASFFNATAGATPVSSLTVPGVTTTQVSPTIPPDPWEIPPKAQVSPTIPPDPWEIPPKHL